MLIAAAVCPHPPLLIPAAMGEAGAGPELAGLRAACAAAVLGLVRSQPDQIAIVGSAPSSQTYPWPSAGSLHRYGIPWSTGPGHPVLPLSLTAGTWLLMEALDAAGIPAPGVIFDADGVDVAGEAGGAGGPAVTLTAVADGAGPAECRRLGESLAGAAARVGLLAMGDGSAKKAIGVPGAPDAEAEAYDDRIAAALAAGDAGALGRLDPGRAAELRVNGRAPWQVLAGAAEGTAGMRAVLHHRSAPYDVSYLVASWAAEEAAAAELAGRLG